AAIARENCFERLYMRFRERLLKYARRRGNPDEAEDLVEDVYVGLWTNDSEMPCGPNEKETEEYLERAVKNRLIDEGRSQKSKGSFLDDLAAFIENMLWKVVPASWRAERDDIRRHLERVLKKLPERCREVYRLRRLCELSIEETATELGISVKTVRVH